MPQHDLAHPGRAGTQRDRFGHVSPNTACRVFCKRLLKRKGYHLVYEKMLVMPSNFATQANQQLNHNLIRILPQKTKKIITMLSKDSELVF